jgi:hypothetical protein
VVQSAPEGLCCVRFAAQPVAAVPCCPGYAIAVGLLGAYRASLRLCASQTMQQCRHCCVQGHSELVCICPA